MYGEVLPTGKIDRQRLTIGEMAKINHTSIQTLRLYDRKGLFKPVYTNDETGYRYYSAQQCAHLDMIKSMQSMGLSLKEIKELLEESNPKEIIQRLKQECETTDKKARELAAAKKSVEKAITNYDRYICAPPDGTLITEFIAERRIYVCKIEENTYDIDLDDLEILMQNMQEKIALENLTGNYYSDTCNIIRKKHFKKQELYSNEFCVFIDEDFPSEDIEIVPANMFLCYYTDSGKDEGEKIKIMMEYIKKNKLKIVGDFFCEAIANMPKVNELGRNAIVKLQVAVDYCSKKTKNQDKF